MPSFNPSCEVGVSEITNFLASAESGVATSAEIDKESGAEIDAEGNKEANKDNEESTKGNKKTYENGASAGYAQFCFALREVCNSLARMMAADGEGATRLVTVRVFGAANATDADIAARTIANSPLVKTAIFGHDCNWGRIAAAVGRSGAAFNQENADIDIMGIPVCRGGLSVGFSEEEALKRFENNEITIDVNLGAGNAHTRMWTCDLTHDYITINGDYRT